MNADTLLLGIGFSVPLTFGLLSAAFDVAAHRSRRRNSIPLARSTPEDRAEALLNEWLCPEQRPHLAQADMRALPWGPGLTPEAEVARPCVAKPASAEYAIERFS